MSQDTMDRDDAQEQIGHIRREMERGENAGDPSFIDEYWTDDVVVIAPGWPPVVGKDASKKGFEEMFGDLDIEVEFTSEEVVVGAKLAFDRITSQETHIPKEGGEPTEHTTDAIYIYRQSPEGDWKVSHMMAALRE